MGDRFSGNSVNLSDPWSVEYLIVPDSGADLPDRPRYIRCVADGTLHYRMDGLNSGEFTDTFCPMVAGDLLAARATRVLSTTTGTFTGCL